MKNSLMDLNNHLFAQIERLSEEGLTPEKIDQEAKRGEAIVALADQIIRNAGVQLAAARLVSDHGHDPTPHLPAAITSANAKLIENKRQ